MAQLNIVGELKETIVGDYFTAKNIGFCGMDAPLWLMLLLSAVFALACLAAASFLLRRRIRRQ